MDEFSGPGADNAGVGLPSEAQLLADAVLRLIAESEGSSLPGKESLIAGLKAAWSSERLSRLIGPDIELLQHLEYVRTIIVEYHRYHRLRGISVDVADFDGEPVRIAANGIEVDRRAVRGLDAEKLRLAMLEAMLTVADGAARRSAEARRSTTT